MSYTEGPWMIHEDAHECAGEGLTPIGPEDRYVCHYENWEDDEWAKETSKDNAHLIAAAPDLLEACKAMIFYNYYEQEKPASGTREYEVYRMALNAIDKAEGK